MKKLIIISILIAIIIGAGVAESIISHNTYSEILKYCDEIEVALDGSDNDISQDQNIVDLCKKIESRWDNFRVISLMFGNHNQVKDVSQKIEMLKGYIVKNDEKESFVTLLMLRSAIRYLSKELVINYENIL